MYAFICPSCFVFFVPLSTVLFMETTLLVAMLLVQHQTSHILASALPPTPWSTVVHFLPRQARVSSKDGPEETPSHL